MLNGKFVMALAAAMVLATLYGCSSSGVKNDRDMYKEQAEELQGQLTTANGEVDRLTGELTTANGDVDRLTGDLATANGEVDRLTGELATALNDATTANGEVDRLTGDLATANGEVDRLTGDLATANGEVARLTGDLATANGEVARLTGDLATANGEVARLTGDLTTANGEVARLTGDLATANGEVDRLKGELATARADNTTANDEVDRLTGDLATANGEVARLTGELATANGEVDRLKGELATALTDLGTADDTVAAYATAQNARDDSTDAGAEAADASSEAADLSGKLTTRSAGVAGDSAKAAANAQAVLDTEGTVNNAVTNAQAALDSVTGLLDVDADPTDPLTRALQQAMAVAEGHLEDAIAIRDGAALAAALVAVRGADPEAVGYPKTPADFGMDVAMDINEALGPASGTDGSRLQGAHTSSGAAPDLTAFPDAVQTDDQQGTTWEVIVGSENVTDQRIASTGDDTDPVRAMSFGDMLLADAITANEPALGDVADGAEFDDGDYQGIGGITFCAGDDCSVTQDPDDSTILVLTGSWYFTPDDAEEKYIRNPADTEYVTDNKYVAFGHWLAENSGGVELTDVNTYATTASGGVVLLGTTADLTDTSATYTGTAVGMSVERTTDEDGAIESRESGAFTADVTLEATFGGSPTLGGTVSNFEGPGTDAAWSVELQVRSFSTSGFNNGVTITTDDTTIQKGVWSADAYGFTDERPTGVYGAFNAHFTDGHAAGAYAVRK